MTIRPMNATDGAAALALWKATPGMRVTDSDQPEELAKFLSRNPGLSIVAEEGGRIVATTLAGHDGRRGFLYHVAVAPEFRGQGLSGTLVGAALSGLKEEGIFKVHIFVRADNTAGISFWMGPAASHGWKLRDDVLVFSRDL